MEERLGRSASACRLLMQEAWAFAFLENGSQSMSIRDETLLACGAPNAGQLVQVHFEPG